MQISYLHEGVTHTNYSDEYMTTLGMDDEQKEFTLSMREAQIVTLASSVRQQRDVKLDQAAAWLERHKGESALGIPHALACTELDLHSYMQALRDVPQQEGFPLSYNWPALAVSQT